MSLHLEQGGKKQVKDTETMLHGYAKWGNNNSMSSMVNSKGIWLEMTERSSFDFVLDYVLYWQSLNLHVSTLERECIKSLKTITWLMTRCLCYVGEGSSMTIRIANKIYCILNYQVPEIGRKKAYKEN